MVRTPALIRLLQGLAVVTLLAVVTACGGAPKWVKDGSPAMAKEDKAFYGVGAFKGSENEPLAWEAAENRARAEIAKNFETYTAYLMRDYAANTTAGDFTKASDEQNVERAIKTFTAVTLHGVRKVGQYKDDKKKMYYVLAKLDLKDMQAQLAESKQLSEQVRDYVKKNAERLFDKLEKEEDKRAPK